ncbi:MAG: hypothetical protein JST40_08155 [Armatimonadetes bacterium]|nr:hypothetical protein [Armatimonadota bacterium]
MITLLAASLLLGFADGPIEPLRMRATEATKLTDSRAQYAEFESIQIDVLKLISEDALKSGAELRKAAECLDYSAQRYPHMQVQYELLLSAASLEDAQAQTELGKIWDKLLVTMGRYRRLGVEKMDLPFGGERYRVVATSKAIRGVYGNPVEAQKIAEKSKDNPEIKKIVDADQAARQGDWSKMKAADFERIAKDDAARLRRILAIIRDGQLLTANDFARAGLVCQHGELFEHYALAHELSVCAMLLGDKSASWLAGASYDRMLDHSGHPQRFATQYWIANNKYTLSTYDPKWINDTERKAVVHVTLDEAINRKWD